MDCYPKAADESDADHLTKELGNAKRYADSAWTFSNKATPDASADLIENALHQAQLAVLHYQCAQHLPGAPELAAQYNQAAALQAVLRQMLSHACATDAQVTAARALEEARNASSLDDATAAASRAAVAATQADAQRDNVPDKWNTWAADEANDSSTQTQKELDLRKNADNTICGANAKGRPKAVCPTYGVFGATLSYLWVQNGSSFTTRPHFAAIVVPDVALRWEPWSEQGVGWFALEIGAYTTFLTQSLTATTPTTTKVACSQNASEYENRLPCEANASVYPYVSGYLGATVGKSGVGFLTLAPLTFGVAQVGSRSALEGYVGFMIGALQLNGRF